MVEAAPTASTQAEIARVFAQQTKHQYVVARTTARDRKAKLRRLHDTVVRYQTAIEAAMWQDFRKSPEEVIISEIGVVNTEARHAMRHLGSWMTPKQVGATMALIGTRSEIRYEPKGVCLILSPWNYPINLTLAPLVSAIAAGNCVIIKPSEHAPHSAAIMKKIVEECFAPEEVALFEGDATLAGALLELPFNHIFFTGSPSIGKIVMAAAAKHLSSVTLELGGKSPVIVDETANLDIAAAKIAWLKYMNAGQTCIAPDYVLAHESIYDALTERIAAKIKHFYGESTEARASSPDLCQMVHARRFEAVQSLLHDAQQHGGRVAFGGHSDAPARYIEPTVLTQVDAKAQIWEEEIFGPLLLIQSYRSLDEAIARINAKPKSLAMYIFSAKKRNIEQVLAETRNGGVTVNDCGPHFYHTDLPFGGSNNSGIGKCHGEAGFLEFSNARGITYQNRIFPHTNLFHPPYAKYLAPMRWMLKGILRWF
jgi:aldehyde dehydrogenase (NAD+)